MGMTEKRYFLHKHLIKNDVIHDKICHKWLKGEELESDMNTLYNKYSFLKKENEQLKKEKQFLYENIDFLKKFIENQGFKVRLDSNVKCKDYGLKCLKCPYWNKWSRYCTKWKIWSESR